ncbi:MULTISPECIES: potassium/proton antiporter [unclassified Marinobacter]|uniref:potassium/proton antiporter n=1 Tax=unclassified Marinobacter TaxID=83889 RepID=UPI00200F810E|nr:MULTISPECIES: potassium/proton antiporter [unclassified Marinobacter]UQG56218.1 potassium/proton antiporter [Marinobacter sp. M4C]UQG65022.1 potassium/proton antiporter [Marinobacter sp. M2C]UQG69301.1 potassium/proton antiporter [Marinobacter sp. M1C]
MDPMLTLVGALMLVISIVLSPLSSRVGMPVLLIFLVVGMMMGEDGPGGIRFDDYQLAFLIANLALGVILLDGGMRTRAETFRVGLRPALVLATLGVFLTATGAAVVAWWVFDLHWMLALLVGAIISSTDAAVVFSMLQGSGVHLNERVSATLEIESGSNDPMAIFLTLLMVTLIGNAGENNVGPALRLLVEQFGIGSIAGLIGGVAVVALANRMRLAPPLYPLLVAAGGIAVFSATNALGGSGFLAIYLTGVVIGNRPVRMMPMILQVHDGLAWLAQLCLFLMLGLLVAPSELLPLAGGGLILALALIFVIRPLTVMATLWPFGFNRRELGFISWVGLRGAVPIVLALFPIIAGLPDAQLVFHAAFFIVLVSLLVQGTTMAPLARWLKLEVPADNAPFRRFPLDAPAAGDHELMLFPLRGKNWELPRRLDQLKLPDNTAVAGVFRNRLCLQSQADLEVIQGDVIAVFSTPGVLPELNKSLSGAYTPSHLAERAFFGDFVLNGDALLGDVEQVYGIEFDELPPDLSLAECFAQRTKGRPVIGDLVALGPVTLVVRSMNGDTVAKVGLKMDAQQNAAEAKHNNTKDDKTH